MRKAEAAQHRAHISAFLSNHPGEHHTEEVAKAVGLTPRTAGQLLGGMARGELIESLGKRGKHAYWQWPQDAPKDGAITGDNAPPLSPTPRATPKGVNPRKELELEIDGITIVVGRNPATGRFRVVLEG